MQDSLRRFQFLWDITYLCWNLTTMGYEITPQGPAASQLRAASPSVSISWPRFDGIDALECERCDDPGSPHCSLAVSAVRY